MAGGRGVNGAERLSEIEALAVLLGVAADASRAAFEVGWLPSPGRHLLLGGVGRSERGTRPVATELVRQWRS